MLIKSKNMFQRKRFVVVVFKACEYCLYPLESCEQNVRRLCQDSSIIIPHSECDPNRTIDQRIVRCLKCNVR